MSNFSQASMVYQQVDLHTQIEGASAHKLTDLLFDGALVKLAKAKGHITQNNLSQKGQEISKAIAILTELQSSLSTSDGDEISQNLRALYTYIIELIVTANIDNKLEKLDEARELIQHLRESWNLIPDEQRF